MTTTTSCCHHCPCWVGQATPSLSSISTHFPPCGQLLTVAEVGARAIVLTIPIAVPAVAAPLSSPLLSPHLLICPVPATAGVIPCIVCPIILISVVLFCLSSAFHGSFALAISQWPHQSHPIAPCFHPISSCLWQHCCGGGGGCHCGWEGCHLVVA